MSIMQLLTWAASPQVRAPRIEIDHAASDSGQNQGRRQVALIGPLLGAQSSSPFHDREGSSRLEPVASFMITKDPV